MGDFNSITATPASGMNPMPLNDDKKRAGLSFKVYQELKSASTVTS